MLKDNENSNNNKIEQVKIELKREIDEEREYL